MSHTAGPWLAHFAADLPGQKPGWYISPGKRDGIICDIERCRDEDGNARLIAAAPELLESLESVVVDSCSVKPLEFKRRLDVATALIARVKGDAHSDIGQ